MARKPPCNPPPWGNFTAIDMNTGDIKWQVPFGQINVIGPLKGPKNGVVPIKAGLLLQKVISFLLGQTLTTGLGLIVYLQEN